ncbi:flavin reductase family protein [Nocardiopsis sediminis]|uniref:Flavin reductase family protein n=1 Tax=Nocardiopsis sediminis TaxID=1778267 RepID=A0ABV8FKG5_9ACTN
MRSAHAAPPSRGTDRRPVDADRFRQALGRHPAGVVVVTADVAGEPVGLTATSFTSVSLAPPLVAFYIAESSTTWPKLRRADAFGVHLLADDQAAVAARFAAKGVDRFAHPTSWQRGTGGVPLLDDTAVRLLCRRDDTRRIGDHWLVVGEVVEAEVGAPRPPLLYHQGTFGGFAARS